MESLSLLKYWRGGTGSAPAASMATSTITTLPEPASPAPESDADERADEGPFFDLEFTVPDSHGAGGGEQNEKPEDDEDFNFSMTSEESELRSMSISMSPSDDLFFKEQLIPLESNSVVVAAGGETDPKTQLAVSLLKSATRFRVFILGLRKSKSPAVEPNASGASPKQSQQPNKFFFVKFKVEEVPIVSLFTRDGSSRNLSGGGKSLPKLSVAEGGEDPAVTTAVSTAEEKKSNSKEAVQKYFSKIKPLYVKVSKRYADKLKLSGPLVHDGLPATEEKEAEAEEPAAVKQAEKTLKYQCRRN
ncbi:putative membrane-associated kinase regulator 2 [Platanthera guangdongensis]|uniref:Membrane-associated kinase regulator 2 n=1 Tax=Platanthera guangdongensis TaxID=2320717 RepID=A0ABR2MGS3_9ASPA